MVALGFLRTGLRAVGHRDVLLVPAPDLRLDRAEAREPGGLEPAQPIRGHVRDVDVENPLVERALLPALQGVAGDQQGRVPVLGGTGGDGHRDPRNPVGRAREHRTHGARVQGGLARVRPQVHAGEDHVRALAEGPVGGQERDQRGGGLHPHALHALGHPGRVRGDQGDPPVDLLAGQGRAGARVLLGGGGHLDTVPAVQRGLREHRQSRGRDAVVVGHQDVHGVHGGTRPGPGPGWRPL